MSNDEESVLAEDNERVRYFSRFLLFFFFITYLILSLVFLLNLFTKNVYMLSV